MSIPQRVSSPCGCVAIWNTEEHQYDLKHVCDPRVRRAQRLAAQRKSQEEEVRRLAAPLYYKPFSLLK